MHRLQQQILSRLIHSEELRYAQIKPAEIEGNLFMYHLRQLKGRGLVEKLASGAYCLSRQGQVFADQLSLQTFQPRIQPRIVTLIACRDDQQWLLYRRRRQPLLGKVGFPYGKIHLGETILKAAERELKEKTGLSALLMHRGDGYVSIARKGEPVSQILFHLFQGRGVNGEIRAPGRDGEAFWSSLGELNNNELIPSVADIIRLMESTPTDRRFFTELKYDI